MIQVVYHRKYHKLTVDGHAKSGEAGRDLVCCAASILAYTAAANLSGLPKEARSYRDTQVVNEDGHMTVAVDAKSRYKNIVTLILDTICTGYTLLAHDYPEFITYEIRE